MRGKFRTSLYTGTILLIALLLTHCSDSNSPSDPNPSIQSIMSTTAYIGQAIRIAGKNFKTAAAGYYVDLNGTQIAATDCIYWADTEIVLLVPNGATTGGVTVHIGSVVSNSVNLTIVSDVPANAPIIDYLDMDIAQVRQEQGINGKNFGSSQCNQCYVYFKGDKVDEITLWSNSKIVAMIPDNAVTGKVVIFADGIGSNGIDMNVQGVNSLVEVVDILPDSFTMGTNDEDEYYGPAHQVTITNGFKMSKYEITQKQYQAVMSDNPSRIKDSLNPVERVSWMDAINFCNELSTQERFTPCYTINGTTVTCDWNANGYRLPTEAEWEYACRAGATGKYGNPGNIAGMGWTNENAGNDPHEVGKQQPNAWGLYDMHGNVWEWVWDYYDAEYYKNSPSTDPKGPNYDAGLGIVDKVYRGGSYAYGREYATCSARMGSSMGNYDIGFRVVRKSN